jgi:putative intracellular protease/amidase
MVDSDLNGVQVAGLVTDGFAQVEMAEPRQALDRAGAQTRLVSPEDGRVLPGGVVVTSRKPDDLPAFSREMIAPFSRTRGEQAPQASAE